MELTERIAELTDEQASKAALWLIDELKVNAGSELNFTETPFYNKNTYMESLCEMVGEDVCRRIAKEWEDEKNALQFTRQFMSILAEEPLYRKTVEEAVKTVGKIRLGEEINVLVTVLKDSIPLWLILYFSLRFRIHFRIKKDQEDAGCKEKQGILFEVDVEKQSSLREFFNAMFKIRSE